MPLWMLTLFIHCVLKTWNFLCVNGAKPETMERVRSIKWWYLTLLMGSRIISVPKYTLLRFKQRRRWHPTPVLLTGKSHGWRSLVGCSPWVAKSQTWLSDFPFTFHFHALEKVMATHSSVLAWRIPGTGEPVRLPSMGSHRVGHDWSDLAVA